MILVYLKQLIYGLLNRCACKLPNFSQLCLRNPLMKGGSPTTGKWASFLTPLWIKFPIRVIMRANEL